MLVTSPFTMFPIFTPVHAVNNIFEEASLSASLKSEVTNHNSLVQVDSDTYALAHTSSGSVGAITTFTISADGLTVTEVATLVHDNEFAEHNSLVQVNSDTYALAYTGPGVDGFITTFTISADGSTITEVATLEHDTLQGQHNSLVQVDSDTYALAYAGPGVDGFISTFTISADGSTITKEFTVEHDGSEGAFNSLVQVDSDTYVLAYSGEGADGWITTFTIPADGSAITEVATLEHDTANGQYNSLVQVDSDTYALAYAGDGQDGFISTFTISADGSTITEVATLEHDTARGIHNSLIQVDSDTYALAYAVFFQDGWITTFTISADGSTITEVTTLEHDTTLGIYNSLVQVDSDTYALAYAGASNGFISTFTIPADGSTVTLVINAIARSSRFVSHNSLVQVDSDTYALAYAGPGDFGFITTFTIPIDGSTITEVATLEHDTAKGQYNSLVQVDSDTYALAYTGFGDDGFISTFTISADGSTITEVATLKHDASVGIHSSLVQVDSDTYAVAFQGAGNDGWITTFTIPADGSTITEVATLDHDTAGAIYNSLVQVDSDTYALAYSGSGSDGFISTFTIPIDGSTIAEVATLEHDTVNAIYNSLVQVDSDTYALAYAGVGSDGFISTFTIPADGSTITEVVSLEHDTANGQYNSLVQVDSDTYALAYAGDGSDGFISTFTIPADGSTITEVTTREHDTSKGQFNSLVQIDSDTYALAYTGDVGAISTFTLVNVLDDPDTIAITDVITTTITTPTESTQAFSTSGNLSFNDATVTTTGSGSVTIEKLNSNPESSSPSGTAVGSFFDITSTGTLSDRTVTLSYSDAEVSGVDESSLTINRFSGGTWSALTTTVDTSANTATATTPGFSSFVLSGTPLSSGGGGGGGDTIPPSIVTTFGDADYPVSVGSTSYTAEQLKDSVDTATVETGKPLQISLLLYDNGGPQSISHVAIYVDRHGTAILNDLTETYIVWDKNKDIQIINPYGIISDGTVESSIQGNKVSFTFDVTFAKEFDKSDILFVVWDAKRNGMKVLVQDALQVIPAEPVPEPDVVQDSELGVESVVTTEEFIAMDPKPEVPDWVKNHAGWWAEGQIDDSSFTNGIEFLIQEKIIDIDRLPNVSKDPDQEDEELEEETTHIPEWIKNNAGWWADGLITEDDFVKGIQYLVERGIIKV